MKKSIFAISLAFALASCGGNTENKEAKETVQQPEKTAEVCTYSYSAENTVVSWTAFKTTAKVGVGGKFDQFTISGVEVSEDPTKVFANAKFEIPVGTVNTENPDRDKKIVDHFFGTFTDTESITGAVSHIDGDSATFSIEMNGVGNEVTGHFSVEGETVTLSTTIDLGNWQGEAAVKALNDVCNDLHKGEDGVSKLWPNVDVKIVTTLTKECK